MKLTSLKFAKIKPRNKAGRIEEISRGSECFVMVHTDGDGKLKTLHIEFHGPIADIPSIKNNRQFGGIDPKVLARLAAMDRLFCDRIEEMKIPFPKFDGRVFGIVCHSIRNRSFDEDNATTTIKDWLEPKSKIVGRKSKTKRGWGIGVVDNDSQVLIWPVLQKDLSIESPVTIIELKSFEMTQHLIAETVSNFRSCL